jgi:hypothetical protein
VSYEFSPYGEIWSVAFQITLYSAALYDWLMNCPYLGRESLEARKDVADSATGEWRDRLQIARSSWT